MRDLSTDSIPVSPILGEDEGGLYLVVGVSVFSSFGFVPRNFSVIFGPDTFGFASESVLSLFLLLGLKIHL